MIYKEVPPEEIPEAFHKRFSFQFDSCPDFPKPLQGELFLKLGSVIGRPIVESSVQNTIVKLLTGNKLYNYKRIPIMTDTGVFKVIELQCYEHCEVLKVVRKSWY